MKGSLAEQVLALFEVPEGEEPKELTLVQIEASLQDATAVGLRSAMERLRGVQNAPRKIRAARYVSNPGHRGAAACVFVLGDEPDAERSEETTETVEEIQRRQRRELRARQNAIELKRALAECDNFY